MSGPGPSPRGLPARGPVLPLHRWLVLSHLVVLFLPVAALIGTGALATDLLGQTRDDIAHQATLVALFIGRDLERSDGAGLDTPDPALTPLLQTARDRTLAGFRVVDTRGIVVATSGNNLGVDVSDQEEVARALGGEPAVVARPRDNSRSREHALSSPSRRADVRLFIAEPIRVHGEVRGAVVVSRTPREELQTLWMMAPHLSVGVLLALALTVGLAVAAGVVLSRSLKRLAHASHRIAAGSFDAVAELEPAGRSHVAEARELAMAMATMTHRLQERLRYISEFAGNVSHEFKTPVSALRGTLELLRDDEDMPPAQRERFLDNAMAALDRLSRLVGGLLRLARAEEGGARRVVALDTVARAALGRCGDGVELTGAGALVDANAEQLEAAITNLVENARVHGGEDVHVGVALWTEGAWTGIDVVDDGPGISTANADKVFDRFFTTNRGGGGTGLGLALVRAVAVAHGGRAELDSQPGRTRFRIALPVAPG